MESSASPPLTDNQRRWLNHIQAAEQAGVTLKAYAAEHGLSLSALYSHKAELRRKGLLPTAQPTFAAVRVAAPQPMAELRIHLPNGVTLEAASMVPPAVLTSLCQSLLALR